MFDISTMSKIATIAATLERSESETQEILDSLKEQYEELDLINSREWDMMDHTLLNIVRLKGYSLTTEWQLKK